MHITWYKPWASFPVPGAQNLTLQLPLGSRRSRVCSPLLRSFCLSPIQEATKKHQQINTINTKQNENQAKAVKPVSNVPFKLIEILTLRMKAASSLQRRNLRTQLHFYCKAYQLNYNPSWKRRNFKPPGRRFRADRKQIKNAGFRKRWRRVIVSFPCPSFHQTQIQKDRHCF